MRKKLFFILLSVLLLAAVVGSLSVFTVDRTEFVYLTQFGRHVATYDGADDAQAGLHFRLPWPVQSVQRLDHRLQDFDLPGAELLTRDAKKNTIDKTLTIDAYVCWRIADADGVDRFIRKMGTVEGARSVLGQRINSELGAAVGKMELDELVSTEPNRVDDKREELRKRILEGGEQPLRRSAREEYGIEIVDVRLRRTNHPPAVRQAIFDRIMSEREKKVGRLSQPGRAAGRRHQERQRPQGGRAAQRGGGRGGAAPRPGRRRRRPHPHRRRQSGPAVLRLPQEAGGLPAHPRRQQDHAAAVHSPRTVRHAVQPAQPRRPDAGPARPPATVPTATRGTCNETANVCSCWDCSRSLVLGYAATGLYQVLPGEVAVVRRFGRVLPERPEPGLHLGLPWGMDRVDRVAVDQLRRVVVGYQEGGDAAMPAGQLLTGDHNLVNVQVTIYYKVRPDEAAILRRAGRPRGRPDGAGGRDGDGGMGRPAAPWMRCCSTARWTCGRRC